MPRFREAKKPFDPELINLVKQGKCVECLPYIATYPLGNLVDGDGNHLLHVAAKYNNREITSFLIEYGCDIGVTDSSGLTPFVIAVMHKSFEVASTLYHCQLDNLNSLRTQSNSPYDRESKRRMLTTFHDDLMSTMRARGLSSEQIGEALGKVISDSPHEVVRFHDAAITEAYLRSTSWENVDVKFDELFDEVFDGGDLQHILAILNNAPCDRGRLYEEFCDCVLRKYIHYASESAKKFLSEILSLEVLSSVETLDYLEKKLMSSKREVVELFLKYDFHSAVKARYGRDMLACLFGNYSIDKYFIGEYGEDVTSLLSDEQIDVDGRGYDGKTPLHFAAQQNSIDNVRMLLERGADPNALDDKGRTPFGLAIFTKHCSVDGKCLACVDALLLAGANPLLVSDRFEEVLASRDRRHYLGSEEFRVVIRLAIAQLVVYETLGRYDEKSEKSFNTWYKRDTASAIEVCRRQLNTLKDHKIRDCREWTMFTVLAERPEIMARCFGGEDVQSIFTFVERHGDALIPCYRGLLRKHAEDIAWIRCYRNRAIQVVCQFTGIGDPQHLVVQKIVNYFSVKDLRKFSVMEVSRKELSLKDKVRNWFKLVKHGIFQS